MSRFSFTVRPLILALIALGLSAPSTGAATLTPPKGKVITGVSDTGDLAGFESFSELVGKHPAVLQTFHPWGNGLNIAFRRWQNAEVRPMLHISTADDETRAELITPRQIAEGVGDSYLLSLNSFFSANDLMAYIRPLGEPNRCLNPYSAVTCSGRPKGGDHATGWYKRAFRRIAIVVRGGRSSSGIDAKLASLGMPPVNYGAVPRPEALPAPPVAIVWSPLPAGSPKVKGNWPGDYWPGAAYVDWAGTDVYSNYPHWGDVNRFFRNPLWRSKPFSLTEWGIAGSDNVRFARQIFSWMEKRPRVRMFNYYRGFGGPEDTYNPVNYPEALRVVRNKLRSPRYLDYVFGHAARP